MEDDLFYVARLRLDVRIHIHLSRLSLWFRCVEFAASPIRTVPLSKITPWSWVLEVWPTDDEHDEGDALRIDYSLRPVNNDVAFGLRVVSRQGSLLLQTMKPVTDIGSLERRLRLLTSDDIHATIHERASDHYGRILVAPPREPTPRSF